MIDLHFSNGSVYVWDIKDVEELRTKHRIVGNLVGCLPAYPRQDGYLGLPLQLLNEEVSLLVSRNVARVVTCDDLEREPHSDTKKQAENHVNDSFCQQAVLFCQERTRQIKTHAEQIINGKRKKWIAKHKNDLEFDEDTAIQEELEKVATMPKDLMMVQLFTKHPWETRSGELDWWEVTGSRSKLRNIVFTDLWSKGFYLTAGDKFGGDYLVYPGDPVRFHAHYIAVCVERDTPVTGKFLVAKGRLGSNVKKTVLLCMLDMNESVVYQSLQWSGLYSSV